MVAVRALIVVALIAVGCFFLTVGTVGLLRFPNVYNRMHATSKPTTLGTAAVFLAGFAHFGPGGAGLPSLLGILFLFLTVPTGAHMISRAAQRTGIPFQDTVTWPGRPDVRTQGKSGVTPGFDVEDRGGDGEREKGSDRERGPRDRGRTSGRGGDGDGDSGA
ncbi:cation:proton antiporter [Halobacteriales archaeon QS_5_70_17]|nr:MAG: cation:proton antiporter [Halobacteriales archaeon QS_5_70_17]